jgi:hypothetical protein
MTSRSLPSIPAFYLYSALGTTVEAIEVNAKVHKTVFIVTGNRIFELLS